MSADSPQYGKVPMLPATVVALLGIDGRDPHYFETVRKIVERDPALVTMAFHIANSSAFGGLSSTIGIDQTILRVGARRFISMVLSSHLIKVFVPTSVEMSRLWRHSCATGVAAGCLANVWRRLDIPPDWASTAGLVHNLGALVLAVAHTDAYRDLLMAHDPYDHQIIRAERAVFGGDHQTVGRIAAEQMTMPQDLVEVIAHHHGPGHPPSNLVWLVRTALAVVAYADARDADDDTQARALERVKDLLQLMRYQPFEELVFAQILSTIEVDTRLELDRLGIPREGAGAPVQPY